MKRILIICTSSYQILVAHKIVDEYYYKDVISIAICDTIADVQSVYCKTKEIGTFCNVYLWRIKNKFRFSKGQRVLNVIFGYRKSRSLLDSFEGIDAPYDIVLYSNLSPANQHIFEYIKNINPNIKFEMYEDGFSTYSKYSGDFFSPKNFFQRFERKNFLRTSALYVFNPELLDWKPNFSIRKIKPEFIGKIRESINYIFEYENLKDNYNKRFIFFEESYFADGKTVDDVELLDYISSIVGKDNVFVKIHPRNPTNRFKNSGYITNSNISIPWEVILINGDFENTVFLTLASNAAMNPFFLFGKKSKAVLLFNCTGKQELLYKPIIKYDEKLCSKYLDIFFIPNNKKALADWLRGEIRNENSSNSTNETE